MPFFSKDFSAALATKEASTGGYLNPSSLDDGEQARFCILSEEPLEGFEIWFTKMDGGMTKRITPEPPDDELLAQLEKQVGGTVTVRDGKRAIKRCCAFFVYQWRDPKTATSGGDVKVFSANQKTLLAEIERLAGDPDYADLSGWDVKVSRRGRGTDTKYSVDLAPTWRDRDAIGKAVIEAWDAACKAGASLDALYDGGNPFGAKA